MTEGARSLSASTTFPLSDGERDRAADMLVRMDEDLDESLKDRLAALNKHLATAKAGELLV